WWNRPRLKKQNGAARTSNSFVQTRGEVRTSTWRPEPITQRVSICGPEEPIKPMAVKEKRPISGIGNYEAGSQDRTAAGFHSPRAHGRPDSHWDHERDHHPRDEG